MSDSSDFMDTPGAKRGNKRKLKAKEATCVVESEVQPGENMFRVRSPSKGPSDGLRGDPNECSGLPQRATEILAINIEVAKSLGTAKDYLYLLAHHRVLYRILPPREKPILNKIAKISCKLEEMALNIMDQGKEVNPEFKAPEGWVEAEADQDKLIEDLTLRNGTFPNYKGHAYPSLDLLRYTFANKAEYEGGKYNRKIMTRQAVTNSVFNKVRSLTLSLTLSIGTHIDASPRPPRPA